MFNFGVDMKFYYRQVFVYTVLFFVVALPLSLNSVSALITARSVVKIPLKEKQETRVVSKLEIIVAIRAKYTGKIEILSVRKKGVSYGKNCHYVKIIDSEGEFIEIHIACKNKT